MTSALGEPSFGGLLTQWTVQPIALVAAALLAGWYVRSVHRIAPVRWPVRRTVGFAAGLLLLVWTTCGFPQVYARSLFWMWTAQALALWLFVPVVLLAGRPLHLAQQLYGADSALARVLRSRPCRMLANPLVGPALVPILSAALFFGPLAGWAAAYAPVGWLVHAALVMIGVLILLPLIGIDDASSSLAVGLSVAIGMVELVIDAVPGIVLRLHTHPVTDFFAHRSLHAWSPGQVHDQHIAGAILWCVAEVIDLPFLLLVFQRWQRADAREAADVDAVLEAERISRSGADADVETARDVPWWLSDPAMQERFRREG